MLHVAVHAVALALLHVHAVAHLHTVVHVHAAVHAIFHAASVVFDRCGLRSLQSSALAVLSYSSPPPTPGHYPHSTTPARSLRSLAALGLGS